jgi:hypothetical protein
MSITVPCRRRTVIRCRSGSRRSAAPRHLPADVIDERAGRLRRWPGWPRPTVTVRWAVSGCASAWSLRPRPSAEEEGVEEVSARQDPLAGRAARPDHHAGELMQALSHRAHDELTDGELIPAPVLTRSNSRHFRLLRTSIYRPSDTLGVRLPGLSAAGRPMRPRPWGAVPGWADLRGEPDPAVPAPSPGQDPWRHAVAARSRRHRHLDRPLRP